MCSVLYLLKSNLIKNSLKNKVVNGVVFVVISILKVGIVVHQSWLSYLILSILIIINTLQTWSYTINNDSFIDGSL